MNTPQLPQELWDKIFQHEEELIQNDYIRHIEDVFTNVGYEAHISNNNYLTRDGRLFDFQFKNFFSIDEFKKGQRLLVDCDLSRGHQDFHFYDKHLPFVRTDKFKKEGCSNYRAIESTELPCRRGNIVKTLNVCDKCNCEEHHRDFHYDYQKSMKRDGCRLCTNMLNSTLKNSSRNNVIMCSYNVVVPICCPFDLNEIKRNGGDYWVKWNTLYVALREGEPADFEFDGEDPSQQHDFKRPDETEIDDDWFENNVWINNNRYDDDGYLIDSDDERM